MKWSSRICGNIAHNVAFIKHIVWDILKQQIINQFVVEAVSCPSHRSLYITCSYQNYASQGSEWKLFGSINLNVLSIPTNIVGRFYRMITVYPVFGSCKMFSSVTSSRKFTMLYEYLLAWINMSIYICCVCLYVFI